MHVCCESNCNHERMLKLTTISHKISCATFEALTTAFGGRICVRHVPYFVNTIRHVSSHIFFIYIHLYLWDTAQLPCASSCCPRMRRLCLHGSHVRVICFGFYVKMNRRHHKEWSLATVARKHISLIIEVSSVLYKSGSSTLEQCSFAWAEGKVAFPSM